MVADQIHKPYAQAIPHRHAQKIPTVSAPIASLIEGSCSVWVDLKKACMLFPSAMIY
jgi:hypothetical protein